jgi:hypothetical protein
MLADLVEWRPAACRRAVTDMEHMARSGFNYGRPIPSQPGYCRATGTGQPALWGVIHSLLCSPPSDGRRRRDPSNQTPVVELWPNSNCQNHDYRQLAAAPSSGVTCPTDVERCAAIAKSRKAIATSRTRP